MGDMQADSVRSMPVSGQVIIGKTAAQVAAAAIGGASALAVGGPLGVVAGVFVGPALTPIFEAITALDQRGLRNVEDVLEQASAQSQLPVEEIAAWAQADDGRLYLLGQVVRSALRTLNQAKVRTFSRLLSEAIIDDARLDVSTLIVQALAELEAPHIRVLHAMVHDAAPILPGPPVAEGAWRMKALAVHLPHLRGGFLPLMRVLDRNGLAQEGLPAAEDDPAWRLTDFGRDCLAYLESGQNSDLA